LKGGSQMQVSPEIKELLLRLYAVEASADLDGLLAFYSHSEDVLAIGTDPTEGGAGFDPIARVYQAQLPEMGGHVRFIAGDIQAFEEGTVGWAADCCTLQVLGREIPMRHTTVFHREGGEWRIVQHHVSMGVPNAEALGRELTTS
jgi:ketosteroid isomerase-like protein